MQTALDAALATSLADKNSAIAQENMIVQAEFEKTNAEALMGTEFGLNQITSAQNAALENMLAANRAIENTAFMQAQGVENRLGIKTEGSQARKAAIVQGEQQRKTDRQRLKTEENIAEGRYGADRAVARMAASASQYGADRQLDIAERQAETQELQIDTQYDIAQMGNQSAEDIERIRRFSKGCC